MVRIKKNRYYDTITHYDAIQNTPGTSKESGSISNVTAMQLWLLIAHILNTLMRFESNTINKYFDFYKIINCFTLIDPGGTVVIIFATGSEVRGFKPGRGRWFFSERKNPEFLRKGSKAVGPAS